MPEVLSVSQMLANNYEPKRKFRWLLQIDGVDAFVMKTAARPQITMEETVVDYVNVKRYLSGKPTWNPINVTLHDPIAPSAAEKVIEWLRLNFEAATGRMGYATVYKKDVTLKMLDPQGAVIEQWRLQGSWPMDINWGDLDYASSDNVEIAFTMRFDQGFLEF